MKSAAVICGPIGSGKSTAAAYIASEFGLKVVSFGAYVKDISEQAGSPSTREALQDLGDSSFRSMGSSGLLRAVLEYAGIENHDSVVFDGVRHPGVLTEIRQSAEATIAVFLQVSREERHRRYNSRLSYGISLDEFKIMESHPVEAEISNLAELCDLVIDGGQHVMEVQSSLHNHISLLARPDP